MRFLTMSLLALLSLGANLPATDYTVAPTGGDFSTIQAALNVAVAGDRILVFEKTGGYIEKLVFPNSGDATNGYIELVAAPGQRPALDGTGVPGPWMITLQDRSYIKITGLEIRNNLGVVNDGSGIRIQGAGSHIEISNCVIHDMRGFGAMAITVYGTSLTGSIHDLIIDGNEVYDCEPADSEAITLNGNVEQWKVTNNRVRDVNNIGIDFIGGETSINTTFVARNGLCSGNVVERANSNYGGGYAGGIYVDGGRDIVIENNIVVGCDLGIEIGAENAGLITSGVIVRNNLIYDNDKVGIVFGGYAATTGRVESCSFVNNLCYGNDTLADGNGELWIQYANNNTVANNIFVCGPQQILLSNYNSTTGNTLNHNLWFSATASSPAYIWNSTASNGLAAFQTSTGQGTGALSSDPLLRMPLGLDALPGTLDEDFRLLPGSPAIDAGNNSAITGALGDFHGLPRLFDDPDSPNLGTGTAPIVDLGAHEQHPLTTNRHTISLTTGGSLQLNLDAGAANANSAFVLATSGSGTAPGLVVNGLTIPLNLDDIMLFSLMAPNAAPFSGFQGTLDSSGEGAASLTLPGGLPTSLVGQEFHTAYVLIDSVTGVNYVSNSTALELEL